LEERQIEQFEATIMRVPVLVVLCVLAVASPAHATLITFDDGIANGGIGSFYSSLGVTFSGATWRKNFGRTGSSGPLGLASIDPTPYNWDMTSPMIATFSSAISTASVVVLDLGQNGFTLNAYDNGTGGDLVSTVTLFGVGTGNDKFQTLSVSAPSIFRVEMFQALSTSFEGVMLDDLRFTASEVVTPEPATLSLLALGLGGAALMRRRRTAR
jgi:hypothetical protein